MPPKPPKLLLLAVSLISAAALGYAVLLLRLFAIIHSHPVASMSVSLALLGYGIGGCFLTRCRQALLPQFGTVFTVNAALFGLGTVACFRIARGIPIDPPQLLWSLREWGHWLSISAILAVPFFLAANCIGFSLQRYHGSIGRIHAATLFGAAAGAVTIVALLFVMFPNRALHLVGFVGIAAALLGYAAAAPQPRWVATVSILSLALLTVVAQTGTSDLTPREYKPLSQLLQVIGTERIKERSSPLAMLTVVGSRTVPLQLAPGLSVTSRAEVPEQLAVFTDGDRMSVLNRWDGDPASAAYLRDVPSALPYHLLPARTRVLVLEAGGGTDVLQAIVHDAAKVDAVELNPQLIYLAKRSYGGFVGHLYDDPRVTVHFADARAFAGAAASRYSLIQLASTDGVSGDSLHLIPANHLYTREALTDYLSRLEPGGFLAISRRVREPPREDAKLLATATAVFEGLDVDTPGKRLAWIRGREISTLLIKNGELTAGEIARIRRFCAERAFDIAYLPGAGAVEGNQRGLPDPPFFTAAAGLLGPGHAHFVRDYPFEIQPATDDRPYFFQFFRWPLLGEAWWSTSRAGWSLRDLGYPLLVATLLLALVVSVLLIVAPQRVLRAGDAMDPGQPRRLRTAVYFVSIGMALAFTAIVWTEKFTLYLAHPLYAVPVVLAGFLAFAGIGSQLAAQVPRRSARGRAAIAAIALTLMMALQLGLLPGLLHGTLHLPTTAKIVLVLACMAPLAVCMGVLLPLGMTRLTYQDSALLPWAYTINGCVTVVALPLASLLAIHFGQTGVLAIALVLFGLAAASVP